MPKKGEFKEHFRDNCTRWEGVRDNSPDVDFSFDDLGSDFYEEACDSRELHELVVDESGLSEEYDYGTLEYEDEEFGTYTSSFRDGGGQAFWELGEMYGSVATAERESREARRDYQLYDYEWKSRKGTIERRKSRQKMKESNKPEVQQLYRERCEEDAKRKREARQDPDRRPIILEDDRKLKAAARKDPEKLNRIRKQNREAQKRRRARLKQEKENK